MLCGAAKSVIKNTDIFYGGQFAAGTNSAAVFLRLRQHSQMT